MFVLRLRPCGEKKAKVISNETDKNISHLARNDCYSSLTVLPNLNEHEHENFQLLGQLSEHEMGC
jgi:hypothetical protein